VIQEFVEQFRVEPRSPPLAHDPERPVEGEGRLVHAPAHQGVEDVGHRRDAALHGDVAPRQAARIARAVPTLVVRAGDDRRHGQQGLLGPVEDLETELGVPLDELELTRGDPARLEQDAVRHADLAHVVHGAGHSEGAASLLGEPAVAGQHLGVAAHPLHVLPRLEVAPLDGAGQRLHGVLAPPAEARLALLELAHRVAQSAGPFRHHVLEVDPVGGVLGLGAGPQEGVGRGDEDLVLLEGLDHVPVGTEAEGDGGERHVRDVRHHDDGHVRVERAGVA